MGIIQKRADELKPGDVLSIGSQQHAVLFVEISGQNVGYQAIPIAGGEQDSVPALRHCHASYTFSVASPDLTPAQQHAEELAKRLWAIVDDIDNGNFADLNAARDLLDKIKPPEPPTLAETLAILVEVREALNVPGLGIDRGQRLDAIIARARRAGLLK